MSEKDWNEIVEEEESKKAIHFPQKERCGMFKPRKIKFRVWNKGKMIYDVQMWEDFPYMVAPQGEYVNCKLMQYTGVKDCNNKEIYEGDIVHVTDSFHGDSKAYKGVVKFVGGYYQIEGQGIRNTPLGWIISSDDIEVIGNIFENPELLREVHGDVQENMP